MQDNRTDWQRLQDAFARLRKGGFFARMDFECCGSCGHYGLSEQVKRAAAKGKAKAGYVFFHRQAGDRDFDERGGNLVSDLWLQWAAVDETPAGEAKVRKAIGDAVLAEGLFAGTTGTIADCVRVLPIGKRGADILLAKADRTHRWLVENPPKDVNEAVRMSADIARLREDARKVLDAGGVAPSAAPAMQPLIEARFSRVE